MKKIYKIDDLHDIVEMLENTQLTYKGIAEHVRMKGGKLSHQTVCNWFNHKVKMPQMGKVLDVARAFNYSVEMRKSNV